MLLGRIISETDIDVGKRFECVVGSVGIIEEPTIPTLYVGMTYTNRLFEGMYDIELDILTRRMNEIEFWTFSRKEQRSYHTNDLYDFKRFCYERVIADVKYEFIDPLLLSDEEHTKKFNEVKGEERLITCNVGDMVYIYDGTTTYGINLMFYQFMGLDRTKLLARVKAFSTVFLNTEEILIEYNDFMEEYNHDKMYLPYLYSIMSYVN